VSWWLWILVGFALLVVELLTPAGFFALFFGFGAIAVGLLAALGWAGPPWSEWLLFTLFAVAGVVLLRGALQRRFRLSAAPRRVDDLVGEVAVVTEEILPGGVGRAELRGSTWSARAAVPEGLAKGLRSRVEKVEGLTLWLRPE
jgi:membrane protein implicated in regulation of membrane protease activity